MLSGTTWLNEAAEFQSPQPGFRYMSKWTRSPLFTDIVANRVVPREAAKHSVVLFVMSVMATEVASAEMRFPLTAIREAVAADAGEAATAMASSVAAPVAEAAAITRLGVLRERISSPIYEWVFPVQATFWPETGHAVVLSPEAVR